MKVLLHLLLSLVALSLLAAGYSYAYTPIPEAHWQTLRPGLEYRAVPLRTGEKGAHPVMHQVRVDTKLYKFHLVLAKDYGQTLTTVANLRKKIDALCAVNASFFDEHCDLLGYHSIGTRVINPNIAPGNVLTGILMISPNYSRIWDRDSFSSSRAEVAFQVGPRLVVDGQPTTGLRGAPARLSGAAIDTQQRLTMFATSLDGRLTLSQCQSILMGRKQFGGVNPYGAINFDGGSSTGMSIAVDSFSLECPSLALIPSVLAITPRAIVK